MSLTEEELVVTEKLYDQAINLQLEFFASQPISKPTVVPLSLVQDLNNSKVTIFCEFDKTCWLDDSTTLLIKLAFLKPAVSPQTSAIHLAELLEGLPARYEKGVSKCVENILSHVPEGPIKNNFSALFLNILPKIIYRIVMVINILVMSWKYFLQE